MKGCWATKADARTELQCDHFLPHKRELKSRRESVKRIDKLKKVEKNAEAGLLVKQNLKENPKRRRASSSLVVMRI